MSRLRQIQSQFDWEAYIKDHFEYKATTGGEYRIDCPKCHNKKKKLYVNSEKGVFHCFRCGYSSREADVFDFVSCTEGIPRPKVILRLNNEYRVVTPLSLADMFATSSEDVVPVVESLRVLSSLPDGALKLTVRDSCTEPFWRYLESRGLTEVDILKMGTHYVPSFRSKIYRQDGSLVGDLGRRVLWPVYGGDHDLVSWCSRTIREPYHRPDKYLNAVDTDISKTLWPFVPPSDSSAILVEGILDAYAYRRKGFCAYATFGKKLSKQQLKLLYSWGTKEVIFSWDKDAKQDTLRALDQAKVYFEQVKVANMSTWGSLDPGDCLNVGHANELFDFAIQKSFDVRSIGFLKWQLQK